MMIATAELAIAEDVEVAAKGKRRQFTAKYKQEILRKAEACTQAGEIGALLRSEGLYSSHLTSWRHARERGELAGLAPRTRGRKPVLRTRGTRESSSSSGRSLGSPPAPSAPKGSWTSKKSGRAAGS